ncbi:MAG: hypothetical protein ACHBN1_36940 [Heteroscytonema crispum UTEX LB 1556]
MNYRYSSYVLRKSCTFHLSRFCGETLACGIPGGREVKRRGRKNASTLQRYMLQPSNWRWGNPEGRSGSRTDILEILL